MKTRQCLIVDAVALVVYLLAANPALTGLFLHEWLSLGVFVVLGVHTAQHYDWVLDSLRNVRHLALAHRGNLLLDACTLVVFMVVMVSGIMVSRHVLPAFGLVAPGYFFWNPLHALFAKILLALLLVHVVVHARWLMAPLKALGRAIAERWGKTGAG